MALPIRPNNPNIPIPNTTFSSPLNIYVDGPYFPVVMGTGIDVGTGTKVADLNNQGVLEFSGATGDINLLAGTGISVVETTSGADSDFTITNTGVTSLVAGSNITLSASSGTVTISAASGPGGTVTSVGTGVGLTGGPITSSGTISLDVSGVAPGSYTYPSITVDAYGRVTVAANGTAPVTAITGTAPVQVTGSAPTLNVAVAASSTSAPGIVQLVDALNSTSTTEALTANQGKVLQDQISALSASSNLTFAGTIDGSTGLMVSVSTEAAGLTTPFVVGQAMPAAATENEDYFTIVSVAGTMTPPGGSSTATTVGDWFLSTGTAYQFLDTGFNPPYASTTEAGIVELADNAETQAGTDATLAVTAAGLQSKVSDSVSTASSTSIASSQAVKDAYDAATAAQTDATQALADAAAAGADVGDLSTLTTTDKSSAVAAINEVDANADQALSDAAAAQATANAAIPCAAITAKGDLIAGSAASTPTALTVGADGQILYACSTATSGLCWAAAPTGPSSATPIVEGLVFGCTDTTNFNYGLGDGIFGALTTGTLNIAIGSSALASSDTGTSNTAIGIGALYTTTSGSQNVALGQQALFSNVSGGLNVAVGSNALQNTTGDANTAFGNFAGNLVTTGCSNILIGNQAGGAGAGALDTGNNNVVIGNCVSPASNSADCQLAIGVNTVCWLTGDSTGAIKPGAGVIDCANSCGTAGQVLMSDGANAICWGSVAAPSAATPTVRGTVFALTEDISANLNTGLGQNALKAVPTGYGNTALGWRSGCDLTTGSANTLVGENTFVTATSSFGNTAVGDSAGNTATGSCNVFLGLQSGYRATGNCNTFIGYNAVCGAGVSGIQNVAIGYGVSLPVAAGNCQLVLGFASGQNWLTGDSTKAIKPGAGIIDCANSCGTAGQILASTGANAIEWIPAPSGASPATPTVAGIVLGCTDADNATLGCNAMAALSFGLRNVAVGCNALRCATTPTNNVAIGADALFFATGACNVGVGDGALGATSGNGNVAIGCCAYGTGASGSFNTAIGYEAGLFTTGNSNVAIGCRAQVLNPSGSCQLALGFGTGLNWLTGDSTKAIKPGAGIIDCAGSCGTAGQVLSSNGSNAIEWITPASGGSPATPSTEGTVYAYTDLNDQVTPAGGNAALGNGAGAALTTSDLHNTIVGSFAGGSLTGVTGQTALGFGALAQATTPATPGEVNLALGYLSGFQMTTGGNNILIGQQAGLNYTTESGNIIIGNSASGDPADAGIIRIGHGSQQAYIQLDAGGAIDISGSTAGTAGQVLTSGGPNQPPTWATPSGGSSPVTVYNQLVNVTASTAASVIGWEGERGTSSSYLQSGNVSAMLFITANSGTNGTTPVAWAQIMISSLFGTGLSQVIASDTTGGTFSIASVIYPAYSDTTVQFTSTTTESPMLFNIALTWFGGFRYNTIVYGTAAT